MFEVVARLDHYQRRQIVLRVAAETGCALATIERMLAGRAVRPTNAARITSAMTRELQARGLVTHA